MNANSRVNLSGQEISLLRRRGLDCVWCMQFWFPEFTQCLTALSHYPVDIFIYVSLLSGFCFFKQVTSQQINLCIQTPFLHPCLLLYRGSSPLTPSHYPAQSRSLRNKCNCLLLLFGPRTWGGGRWYVDESGYACVVGTRFLSFNGVLVTGTLLCVRLLLVDRSHGTFRFRVKIETRKKPLKVELGKENVLLVYKS